MGSLDRDGDGNGNVNGDIGILKKQVICKF